MLEPELEAAFKRCESMLEHSNGLLEKLRLKINLCLVELDEAEVASANSPLESRLKSLEEARDDLLSLTSTLQRKHHWKERELSTEHRAFLLKELTTHSDAVSKFLEGREWLD